MKYSLLAFFVLFSINNLLHYINEKVVIVIFTIFFFCLVKFLSNVIESEFQTKIEFILKDINIYMNAVFNFLYFNKLFYLNLKALSSNFISLVPIFKKRISNVKLALLLKNKTNSLIFNPVFFK
jgi:hypothetical protein